MNIGGIFEGQTAKNCEKSSNGFLRFLQKGLVTDVPKLAQFITSILSKNVFIKFPYLKKIKMKIVTTTATLTVPWSGLRRRQKKISPVCQFRRLLRVHPNRQRDHHRELHLRAKPELSRGPGRHQRGGLHGGEVRRG